MLIVVLWRWPALLSGATLAVLDGIPKQSERHLELFECNAEDRHSPPPPINYLGIERLQFVGMELAQPIAETRCDDALPVYATAQSLRSGPC